MKCEQRKIMTNDHGVGLQQNAHSYNASCCRILINSSIQLGRNLILNFCDFSRESAMVHDLYSSKQKNTNAYHLSLIDFGIFNSKKSRTQESKAEKNVKMREKKKNYIHHRNPTNTTTVAFRSIQ